MKNKKFILSKYFVGIPKENDFKLVEEDIPPLGKEEFLCEAIYFSVDPYMRCQIYRTKEGELMFGTQIAKIIESNNSHWPVGKYVVSKCGWQTLSISHGKEIKNIPEMGDLPKSLALGVMGMPGMTAFFGMEDLCPHLQSSDILLVSTAAGAVGSVVGQIAKIKGCSTVIGLTGTDEKVDWLVKSLGFDHAFNYKTTDLDEKLKSVVPNGINYYFDNVGGKISSTVLKHMKSRGSILICGSISTYCEEKSKKDANDKKIIKEKLLRVKNFAVYSLEDHWDRGFKQMYEWICQGKMKYQECIVKDFTNLPQAFIEIFTGNSIGKIIVSR